MPLRSVRNWQPLTAAIAVLVTAGGAALAGCGSSPGAPKATSTQAAAGKSFSTTGFITPDTGTPKSGGTLIAQDAQDPPGGLDPVKGVLDGLTGMSEYAAVFDLLIRYDPVSQTYVPQLAKSMTSNAAGTAWTIKLRPGVKFTDGTPLNAAAVKYNLERWGGKDSIGYYYPTVAEIKNVTTPDPLTVVVNLNTVDREFNWVFTQGFGLIGSPTAIKKMGEAKFNLDPVGAGPFMVSKYSPNSELDVVRNPNYWGGPAPLDGIHFLYSTGDGTNLQSLQNGDRNLINLSSAPVIQQAIAAGLGGFMWIRAEGSTILMNERPGHILHDVNVRRAVALAIDPNVINERVYGGAGTPSTSLWPKSMFGTTAQGITPDRRKAAALVAAAKVADHWNGSLPILCKPSPEYQQLCLAEQAMLNAAGFKATVKNAPSVGEWVQDLYVKGNYEISPTSNLVTGNVGLYTQLTEEFVGQYTPTGYNNPQMTAAIDLLRTASTPAELLAGMNQVQTVYNQTVPEATESVSHNAVLWKGVGGVIADSNGTILFNKAYLTS